MRARHAMIVVPILGLALLGWAGPADAQLSGLRRKAEAEAAKKLEAEARKAMDDSAKKKAATDSAAKAKAPANSPAAPVTATPASTTPPKADAKVWDNYDFVPGSKVLFYTDFTEDRVGNFARGLRYRSGPAEVVERDGVKMLRATARSEFLIPVGKRLPERFTLEIDVIVPGTRAVEAVSIEGGTELTRGPASANVSWNPFGALILGSGRDGASGAMKMPEAMHATLTGQVVHLRVLMDSAYLKMFVNEFRAYNQPDLQFRRDSVIRVAVDAREENGAPLFITSIRVAESETDVLYDALSAKGRWATHGILFATGKAELQPESRPVLKEIAATLKQHGALKVLIEGHTDNAGSPASNLTLSDARAAAVRAALVTEWGIDGSRITTKGLGDTKPSVPNATAAGRAQNRRVEVVKQ